MTESTATAPSPSALEGVRVIEMGQLIAAPSPARCSANSAPT